MIKAPEIICGPYELTEGDNKMTYCIMDDDKVSIRNYLKNYMIKQTSI